MSEQISFIHCADLHIDSPFKGMGHLTPRLFNEVKESTYRALMNLVNYAIDKQVDFVLMVGDLFDSEQQSLKAQTHLRKAFEILKDHQIDVFVSYGNHDFVNGRIFDYEYPDNVYVFEKEKVSSFTYSKQGEPLATIYGFSYQNRAVVENKTEEYQPIGNTNYHIAMLHGSVSSNTEHDVYAPFNLSELSSKDFDYWALGHIHKRQLLKKQPPIVYPGNIQGRSKKETGEKGCYYVKMNEHNYSLEFQALQDIRFENVEIEATYCQQPQDLEILLDHQIDSIKKEYGKSILSIELMSESGQLEEWVQAGYIEELIDYINESNEKEVTWVVVQQIHVNKSVTWNRAELKNGQHFIGELIRSFDQEEELSKHVEPLFQHRKGRKFLEQLSKEEQVEIKQEAENLILYHLLKD